MQRTPDIPLIRASLALLVGLSCFANSASAQIKRQGQGLGRLLTTEFERSKLDDIRFNVAQPKVYEGPPQLHIDGISQRPGQPRGKDITVWIDGRAHLESELPTGLQLVRNPNGIVTGMSSKQGNNKTEFAKIGEAISRPQTPEEAQAQAQAAQEEKASREATSKLANVVQK